MPVHKHPIAITNGDRTLGSIPIDHELIARLRDSYRQIRESGLRLAEVFYPRLFAAAPHVRHLFQTDIGAQSRKLMASFDAIVENLANPQANAAMLTALGKRHRAYGAKAEHYDLVIELLVESMREILGDRADDRVLHDWRLALRLISNQMIAGANRAPSP